jgi:hypothetical protein
MQESIVSHLFAKADAGVYAVLDAASIPNLLTVLQEHGPEHECLFMGELEPGMVEVVPYLVRLQPGGRFTDWLTGIGWGRHWGVYAVAEANMRAMRQHFRSFLMVYDPEGKPLYFRYYDPRVLRVYLPTCTADELNTVFGPVEYYLLEDQDAGTALRFRNAGGHLHQEKITLTAM